VSLVCWRCSEAARVGLPCVLAHSARSQATFLAAVSPPLLETKALRFLLAPCNASPQSPTGFLDVVSALLGLDKCPAWP
jgi:hypothetical protein